MKTKYLKRILFGVMAFVSMISSPVYASSTKTADVGGVVNAHMGKIKGKVVDNVMAFYGVPYAKNPFDPERRFQAPQAVKPWHNIFDATHVSLPVPQPGRGAKTSLVGAPGDLTVNIWAPTSALNTPKKLPVMVWIPGGAFIREDASEAVYNGSSFAKQGVVVVTVNYRVGVDGFMHLKGMPDNRGILDQISALHWVHDNIADFGGDPNQVTLFGQSAGAASVAILMGTHKTKCLFQKAIMQSPPMQSLTKEEAGRIAKAFAKKNHVEPSVKGISSIPYPQLVEAVVALWRDLKDRDTWGKLSLGGTAFLPVVDGDLIPETPMINLAKNADPSIPVIVGSTDQEARLYLVPGGVIDKISAKELSLLLDDLALKGEPRSVYSPSSKGQSVGDVYADVMSDYTFRMPALHIAESLAKNGNPVWHYNFSWRSSGFGGKLGAAHFIDVPFTFNTIYTSEAKGFLGSEPPESLAKAMHGKWADFAKTGQADWGLYKLNMRKTMRFDVLSQEVSDPEKAVRVLWEGHRF